MISGGFPAASTSGKAAKQLGSTRKGVAQNDRAARKTARYASPRFLQSLIPLFPVPCL